MFQGLMYPQGGQAYLFEAQVTKPFRKLDPKTGELSAGITLLWWGGNQYMKLTDPSQFDLIKEGDAVIVLAEVREFKDNQFAGGGSIVAVNGKMVAGGLLAKLQHVKVEGKAA